jgi:endonuclease YncB( thermonuclease family)
LLGPHGLGQLAVALVLAVALGGCDAADRAETGGGPTSSGRIAARVTKHTDGDTLWLSGIGKVRLIGVDTPEVYGQVECYGHEASAFVERLLPLGSRVRYRLGVDPRDRYGRALAYVYLDDGRLLNMVLVRRGYAQPLTIPPNVELAGRFTAAARGARRRGVGLWAPDACR